MSKTKTTISDYWEAFIAVGGAVMSTADALIQLQSYHQFRPDIFFLIGFILFIGFGTIAYIKLFRKLRDVQKEKQSVNLTFSKPIFQNGAINLIIGEYSGTLVLPNSENESMQEKTQSRKSPQLALNIERIPNTEGKNPKTFEIDCLVGKDAHEIKWKDATTDGDHITKEHTRIKVISNAGYKPIRIMFYYPNRDQAIKIQKTLETLYHGIGGDYYYQDSAWDYVKNKTNIDLKQILEEIAKERTKDND